MATPLPVSVSEGWISIIEKPSPNSINILSGSTAKSGLVSAGDYTGTGIIGAGAYVLFESNAEKDIIVQYSGGQKFYLVRAKNIIYVENTVTPP